jgi:hypothetical protein
MSEWRCRNSARANREHCNSITTERRKNQRFHEMGVYSWFTTPDFAPPALSYDRHHQCRGHGSDHLFDDKIRRGGNIDFIRLSRDSKNSRRGFSKWPHDDIRSLPYGHKRRPDPYELLVKKIFADTPQKVPRTAATGTNRANRRKVIRPCGGRRAPSSPLEGAPAGCVHRQTSCAEALRLFIAHLEIAQVPSLRLSRSFTACGLAFPPDAFIT